MMCQKNDKLDVEQEIIIDKNISAPINKDQVVGKVIFKSGDNILGEANLLANEKIEKINVLSQTDKILKKWFMCLEYKTLLK